MTVPKHAAEPPGWPPDRRPLAALGVATVLGVVSLLWVISTGAREEPPPAAFVPPPSRTAPGERPSGPPPAAKVVLTAPGTGERLRDDRDFTVRGTAAGLLDDLRIFIHAEDRDLHYLADYRAEEIPSNGPWTIRSTGIGEDWGGDGDTYLLQAVLADRTCRRTLNGLDLGNDHYPAFRTLPPGCRITAQTRIVED
ncbi:hypothetical protein [Actinomadura sp. 21ATH]|uniref:hypothetical protein n=1 Tax=Actinomadura sp. 21ATH TaxID=1735444 RepID=UPI0035BF3900